MSSVLSGRASYRWFGIVLLVAAGFYAWYVIAQYGRLNDLNQRQLANAAADLKSTFETAMETVRRFDAKSSDIKAHPSETTSEGQEAENPDAGPSVCDFDAGQPYLELAACTRRDSPPPSWVPSSTITPVAKSTLGIESVPPQGTTLRFQFRADILFKELASVDGFELIFVANKDGDVLYQDAPAGRRWVRYLRWAEQMSRDASGNHAPALRIDNVRQVVGGDAAKWDQARAVSSRTGVRLRGTAHQLYLQPAGLKSLASDNNWDDIIVGAIVPTNWIIRDALAVDADLLGFLVFLVLLGLLGFPFVKLVVLHRHERFRLRDVALLHLSTGALLVLLTCASFAVDGYLRWRAEANQGLELWAGYLEDRLLNELGEIRDQLVKYDTLLTTNLHDGTCGKVRTEWFRDKPEGTTVPADKSWPPKPPGSVYLRMVGWIRPDGQQEWKATADTIGGLIRVDQRPYVVAVQNERLYQIVTANAAATAPIEPRPFFFGPDRSISDGRFYTFVSIPSKVPPSTCADASKKPDGRAETKPLPLPAVLSASGVLLSLDRQPMPAGYGFAIVNREGDVLYHSDRRLSLRENLFDELSQSARVRAQIYSGDEDLEPTRYRERAHDLFLRPIRRLTRAGEREPAGFYIVTFRDTTVERAIVGHQFVAGLVGPMLMLFALWAFGQSALALIARHILKDHWGTWLWPHAGLEHVYKRQAIAFGALLLLTLILSATKYPIAAAFAPFAAAALGVLIYVHGQKDKKDRGRLQRVGWHTAALLLLIVCLVVVPSAVLFRLALNREFGKLIQTESTWIAAQRSDASRDAQDDVPRGRYADALRCAHTMARRALYLRAAAIPAPFIFPPRRSSATIEPTVVRAAGSGAGDAGFGADSITPDCPKRSGEFALVGTSGSPPPSGLETLSPTEFSLVNYLDLIDDMLPIENETASRAHFEEYPSTHSPAGTIVPSIRISGLAVVSLTVMLSLLAWWIRWNANWLFFANYGPQSALATASAPFDQVLNLRTHDEQIALLQVSRERIANPANRRVVEGLLDAGLVRLCPDLRPWPREFEDFLRRTEYDRHTEVAESEHVTDERSWHSVRLLLAMGVTGLAFFLVVTQPAMQSAVLGIASGITSALTTGLKLRDAIISWLPVRKSSA